MRLDLVGQAVNGDIIHWSFGLLNSRRYGIENNVYWVAKTIKQRNDGISKWSAEDGE